MKKILLATGLFVGAHINVTAQFSQGAKDSARMEIQQLTNDWNEVIIHPDSVKLDKILAPEYSLNGLVNRGIWMANTLHHLTTDSLEILGALNITFYGQAAKSEGVLYWKAAYAPGAIHSGPSTINAEFLVTDIWIKRDGHWQVLIRMSLPSKMRQ
ncbi:MAG TPA: hypothetical protein VEV83_16575 [Parafilimonas sp.]|nr:hypothetical protein [Parafilimonas sp.]